MARSSNSRIRIIVRSIWTSCGLSSAIAFPPQVISSAREHCGVLSHRGLAAVDEEAGGRDGGDIYDAAASRPAHLRDGRLRAEGIALEVHPEDRVPALLARVDDRLVEPHAGVVDQHVEPTERLARAPDEADGLGLALRAR